MSASMCYLCSSRHSDGETLELCVTSMHMFTFSASPLPLNSYEVLIIFTARMMTVVSGRKEGGSAAELYPSSGLLAAHRSRPVPRSNTSHLPSSVVLIRPFQKAPPFSCV